MYFPSVPPSCHKPEGERYLTSNLGMGKVHVPLADAPMSVCVANRPEQEVTFSLPYIYHSKWPCISRYFP